MNVGIKRSDPLLIIGTAFIEPHSSWTSFEVVETTPVPAIWEDPTSETISFKKYRFWIGQIRLPNRVNSECIEVKNYEDAKMIPGIDFTLCELPKIRRRHDISFL